MTEPTASRRRIRGPRRGFSFIEAILIVAIMIIIGSLGAPGILKIIHISKVKSFGRTLTTVIVKARLEAIRKGRRVCVDYEARRAVARVDCDDAGAEQIGQVAVPSFVDYAAPDGEDIVDGLEVLPGPSRARIVFNPDGSVAAVGAVRFGDARPRPNYFDLWVGPSRAVPKVKMRKWNDGASEWYAKGEGKGYGGWAWY